MPVTRSIADIELTGHTGNAARALKQRAENTARQEKRAELEKLFADTQEIYDRAIADVRARGEVLTLTRYSSKSIAYTVESVNPFLRIAQKSEAQLAALATILAKFEPVPAKPAAKPGTAEAILAEFSTEAKCPN